MKEEVKHPSRYNQGGIEFWDVEKAFFGMDSHIDHLVQIALEYGVRFRRKNGAEDLRKGANLLNVAADLLDGKAGTEPVEKQHPLQNMTTPNINDRVKTGFSGEAHTVFVAVYVDGRLEFAGADVHMGRSRMSRLVARNQAITIVARMNPLGELSSGNGK